MPRSSHPRMALSRQGDAVNIIIPLAVTAVVSAWFLSGALASVHGMEDTGPRWWLPALSLIAAAFFIWGGWVFSR
jgi:hypothetical protein